MSQIIFSMCILNVCVNDEVLMLHTKLEKSLKQWQERLTVEFPAASRFVFGKMGK